MKKLQTHRIHLTLYYPKENLLFPHVQSYDEQNSEIVHDSNRKNMIQINPYTSYDNSRPVDGNFFEDDPFCNNDDDHSHMPDNELYLSAKLDDINSHHHRSKSDCKKLPYRPRSSKFHSINKWLELFDLPDTDTNHGSRASIAKQSSSSLFFNQSQTSYRNTRTKHDLRPLPRKVYRLFSHLCLLKTNHFH